MADIEQSVESWGPFSHEQIQSLQPQERELLRVLLANAGKILSPDEITAQAGWEPVKSGNSRRLSKVKSGLMRGLAPLGSAHIQTVHGRGTKFILVDTVGSSATARAETAAFGSLHDLAARSMRQLRLSLTMRNGRIGWSHHLADGHVTAVGSAYGLRIVKTASFGNISNFEQLDAVIGSILQLRKNNLWNISSRSNRFEATAWTLLGLLDWMHPGALAKSIDAFVRLAHKDKILRTNVSSLSLAIAVLTRARSDSELLPILVQRLLEAKHDSKEGSFWGRSIGGRTPVGSAAHTSHAAIALLDAHAATGGTLGASAESLKGVGRWLLSDGVVWTNALEDISRSRSDTVTVRHYTVTWVIRALLALCVEPRTPKLLAAVRTLALKHEDGLWDWGGDKGIWATHDALSALSRWVNALDLAPLLDGQSS